MLSYTMHSRLAGLASKPILLSRTFSTSSTHHHNMINLKDALSGKLRNSWTDEILTTEGLRNMNKLAAARAQASLKDKHAHNYNLLLTPSPVSLKAEASAALEIIEHEQRLALARAGVSDTWLALMGPLHRDIDHVSIAFRIPSSEDPNAFKERLRAAGLVGGKFQVQSRKGDEMWKQFIGGQFDHLMRFE